MDSKTQQIVIIILASTVCAVMAAAVGGVIAGAMLGQGINPEVLKIIEVNVGTLIVAVVAALKMPPTTPTKPEGQ